MVPDRHGGAHALHMHFMHAGHVRMSPQTLRSAIFNICCEYEDDRSIFRGPNQQFSLCLLVHRKILIAASFHSRPTRINTYNYIYTW